MKKTSLAIIRPSQIHTILAELDLTKRLELAALLNEAISTASREIQVIDLWDQPELSATYWVLLMTSTDQEEEMDIAKTLLTWKAFSAKDSARILCVPTSERDSFRCFSAHFGIVDCPVLIFGDNPNLENCIKIEPQLLYQLARNKGGLQRFLTRIHSSIENGVPINEIEDQLRSEKFWSGLKLVYTEVKSLVSFGVNADLK